MWLLSQLHPSCWRPAPTLSLTPLILLQKPPLLTPLTSEGSTDEAAAGEGELVIEDNFGEKTISLPVEKPVVTDNRAFELLHDWGVELAAAPIGLIPDTLSDKYNEDTIEFDLGSHREPDLEKIVAAAPDLIWNGQRFSQHGEDLEELAPDATLVDFTPRDGEPLDAELIRLTESLGQIFGHEDEAQAAIDDFNEALERAKEAYDPEKTVMAVNTSVAKSTTSHLLSVVPGVHCLT